MPLSDLQIRKAKQRDKPYKMADGLGLFLQINPNGSKLWRMKYRFLGKEKLLALGAYPLISSADARKKRDRAREQIAEGIDPSVQKQLDRIEAETKARITFKAVADEYYQNLEDRDLAPATLRKKRWHIDDLAV